MNNTLPTHLVDESGSWAWTGVRVKAAVDLTEVRAYADLPEQERFARAVRSQVAFIAAATSAPIDLRWVWEPGTGTLNCYILTRVPVPPGQLGAALHQATAFLRSAPDHVQVVDLTEDELAAALNPLEVAPGGALEVRKRTRVGTPNRPDAGVAYYIATDPLTSNAHDWSPLLRALRAQTAPTVVSVALEPVRLPGEFLPALEQTATHYGRLAREGEHQSGVLSGHVVKLAPDAFAIDAEKLFHDAARRYSGPTWRMRAAIASTAPVADSLGHVLGALAAGGDASAGANYLSDQALGAAYQLARPTDGHQHATFQANLAALMTEPWGTWSTHPVPPVLAPMTWIVDATEAAAIFRLPIAAHGHLPGFAVRTGTPSTVSDYRANGAAITLGTQSDGQVAQVELADLTKHALIVGTTGSGKTNTTLSFVHQLWAGHSTPFLVLEPVNSTLDDYRWLATLPGFEDMLVLTVGDESTAPLRLNPFEVPPGVRVSTHMSNLRQCFDAAFGLWDPLPAIYRDALTLTYARAGFDSAETAAATDAGTWPTLADFISAITTVTDTLDYAGETRSNILAASRLRAQSLATGACGTTLGASRSFPIEMLLNRPVVIELAAVGDDPKEQSLVTALLLMVMTEYYKANRAPQGGLAHVTVIEEAHRLLGKPAATSEFEGSAQARAAEAFANTLAENRKYGEGLLIIEQIPGKLVEDAYKNTNLKLMHRLPSEEDRELLGATMRFGDDQRRHASNLEPFTGYTFHDRMDRPTLITVDNVRATDAGARGLPSAPLATQEQVHDRFAALAAARPEVLAALGPLPGCGPCRFKCSFSSKARAALQAHASDGKDPVAAFKGLLADYADASDAGPGEHDMWWDDLQAVVTEASANIRVRPTGVRGLPGSTAPEAVGQDYQACVFSHIVAEAYPAADRDIAADWIAQYRDRQKTGDVTGAH